MTSVDDMQLAVEHTRRGIAVVWVAGDLNRITARRLARLLDTCTSLRADAARCTHVVVDLHDVRTFGTGGLEVLGEAEQACRRAGASLYVTGVADRRTALPQHVDSLLAALPGFRTPEIALDALDDPAAPGLPATSGPVVEIDPRRSHLAVVRGPGDRDVVGT
ncbi:STAS domain-containing protein [Pseudonocardia sp.]|uniref:STAS domain-containing protein n=1 Tax=Pseudonocardia sp. TaxID=60912 RepID=UPI0026210F5B|nr:STAS domain-containing protein [Pseudonocardia sp.]